MVETNLRRVIADSFVAAGPAGVAIRDRLHVSVAEADLLRQLGLHLGSLAGRDLARRCRAGLDHSNEIWAARKRDLTTDSSARWAGTICRDSNDQWALARRCLARNIKVLRAGIDTIRRRLALPLGQRARRGEPGGYRSRQEWHAKSRRLAALEDRHRQAVADFEAGRARVVRGGKRLANNRHHLEQADLTEAQWLAQWQAKRMFLSADGDSNKRYGNETIRVTPDGQVTLKLPASLAHLANARHARYTLACTVSFPHRGGQWRDRVENNSTVAYTIRHDPVRDRWYVTATWQQARAVAVTLPAALAAGCIGVDTNNDHFAAWRLDRRGNPIGEPRRISYDLSGTTDHRDAQIRHALTRLLHWARQVGVQAIAVEDLDFTDSTTREKHGRRKRFRRLISSFPTSRLRARLVAMAAATGINVVAVDPAYTSRWGAEHWQHPLTTPNRKITRHDAASIVIARRAQGFSARRRTSPPRHHQSDGGGHRNAQARSDTPRLEGTRRHDPGSHARRMPPVVDRTRATSAPNTVRGTRTGRDLHPPSDKEP
jgi:IS605 OrfB family transposase